RASRPGPVDPFSTEGGPLTEQLLLFGGELLRDHHVDMHEQVPSGGPAQHGRAEPAQTKDLPGLGAGRDVQVGGAALDQRDLHAGSECRLGETHGDLVPQVVVVTLESWIVGDDELDVEVACLSTASGRLTPSGQTETAAGGDPCGHVHLDGDVLGHGTGARAM